MKIRNGFVSNSSSSSFIVAFPQRPKTEEETFQMMFNSEEDIETYGERLSTKEIASVVFSDIKSSKKYKSLSLKDIAISFEDRYGYLIGSYVHVKDDGELETYSLTPDLEDFFGIDEELFYKIKNLQHEEREHSKLYYEMMHKLAEKIDPMYRKLEYSAREHILNEVRQTEEWEKIEKQYNKQSEFLWKKTNKAIKELSLIDANAFLSQFKDSYIALFYYEDDGSCAIMENGDVFRNLPCVKISHH
jgi:hypothetical protein